MTILKLAHKALVSTTFASMALVSVATFAPSAYAQSSLNPYVAHVKTPQSANNTTSANTIVDTGNDNEPTTFKLNQGDQIYITNPEWTKSNSCTLGYIDNGYALTAAHCGNKGDIVTTSDGAPLGIMQELDDNMGKGRDVAVIKLYLGVEGVNKFSGDYITSYDEITPLDTICQYGHTTRKVMCSSVAGFASNNNIKSNVVARRGDSGGVMWIKGKGMLAVMSTVDNKYTYGSEVWTTVNKHSALNPPMAKSTSRGYAPPLSSMSSSF